MNQPKRNRGRILSDRGWDKLQDGLLKEFTVEKYTVEKLIERTDPKNNPRQKIKPNALDPGTISKILGREEGVDKKSIQALFAALGLKLEQIDHIPAPKEAITEIDPNFVGREGAIADLNRLIQQGAKAIVIHGKGGIGKTTLAWQLLNTQVFDKILDLRMAKETQNITSAESIIEEWLRRYFDEEPGREFGVTLDRLRQHLRNPNQRIGVLIDNLEPALDGNGRCIESHRRYVELFTALADPAVQSVTLITSRECLREAVVTVEYYRLEGLDIAAWEKFFNSRNIQIDTEVLNAMHQAYGGNAKAMQIIPGAIKEYNNSLAAYWQANKDDLLIERELEGLVVSQFNRLQQLDSSAYKLLCRLGCYRYQDVPRVREKGLCCLLWDVQDSQHRRVIKSLQDRSLVEFYNSEYWLHPVIRAEAVKRLRESEDWEIANRKAAEFWTSFIETKNIKNHQQCLKKLEAFYHYKELQDWENAAVTLVKSGNDYGLLGRLRSFGYIETSINFINLLLDKNSISNLSRGELCAYLGDLYVIYGEIKEAMSSYKQAINFKNNFNDIFYVDILGALAYLYMVIGEYKESISLFESLTVSAQELEESGHQFLCYINTCLSFSYHQIERYEQSLIYLNKAIELQPYLENSYRTWISGYGLYTLGKALLAHNYYSESEELYINLKNLKGTSFYLFQGLALNGLAEIYREKGDFTTALSHHTESIELLEKIGAKCDLAEAYYQLALTYQKMGDTEKSKPNFQQAIRLFTEMEAPKQVEKVQRAMENG